MSNTQALSAELKELKDKPGRLSKKDLERAREINKEIRDIKQAALEN